MQSDRDTDRVVTDDRESAGEESSRRSPAQAARLLSTALRAARFYPAGHDRVESSYRRLAEACEGLVARRGEFEISLEQGRIPIDEHEHGGPALTELAGKMLRRGIRSIRFDSAASRADMARLVTLLDEPPLELAGRGGACAAAASFTGITLIPFRYHVDADREGSPADDSWDVGTFHAPGVETGHLTMADLTAIPGVLEEIDGLRKAGTPTGVGSGDEQEGVVAGILRLALGRLSSSTAGPAIDPPASGVERQAADPESIASDASPLHAIADRIYGIVLTHLASSSGTEGIEWTPGAGSPGLRPVDPRRLLHTRSVLTTRLAPPEGPDALDLDRPANASEVAIGLLIGETGRELRDILLDRLSRSLEPRDGAPGDRDALGRIAALLYSHDIEPMTLVETLSALKKARSPAALARALLDNLPRIPGARARAVAERIDDETLGFAISTFSASTDESRARWLTFLRAASDRVGRLLGKSLDEASPKRRRQMVELAGDLGGSELLRLLDRMARDEDLHVSLAALKALMHRTDEESLRTFERALADSAPDVWRPLANTAAGSGMVRIPRVLDALVRNRGTHRRPIRERLEALRALDRVRGAAGRERVAGLSRYFSIREPAASVLIRREARLLLHSAPASNSPGVLS